MKSIVKVTARGAITLSAEMRGALGVRAGDSVVAEITTQGLLLKPVISSGLESYSDARLQEFNRGEAALAEVLSRSRVIAGVIRRKSAKLPRAR